MNSVSTSRIALLAVAVALGGCSLAPVYQRPSAPVPLAWGTGDASTADKAPATQWEHFVADDELRGLIAAALLHNRDLRVTLLNIEAARAQYRIERSAQWPSVDAQAGLSRERTPADLSSTGVAGTSTSARAGLGMTAFELDLFGRVRNLSEAALQEFLATEQAAQATRLTLISDVVQAYAGYEGALRRQELARRAVEVRERTLDLTSLRRRSGAAGELDYQQAVALAEEARATCERIDRERKQFANALRLLVGDDAAVHRIRTRPMDSPLIVENIVPGVPSEVLARRPDVLAAEHRLKARHADIGAARAAFFPRLSLTAFLGSASAELSGLFKDGQGSWSVAPQLGLPIFNSGRLQAELDVSRLRKDVAVAQYESAIQQAFREVADALTSVDSLRREEAARRQVARSGAAAAALSRARYEAGVDSHLSYLDAQRSDLANQIALVELQTERQRALASLFKALGGGWSD